MSARGERSRRSHAALSAGRAIHGAVLRAAVYVLRLAGVSVALHCARIASTTDGHAGILAGARHAGSGRGASNLAARLIAVARDLAARGGTAIDHAAALLTRARDAACDTGRARDARALRRARTADDARSAGAGSARRRTCGRACSGGGELLGGDRGAVRGRRSVTAAARISRCDSVPGVIDARFVCCAERGEVRGAHARGQRRGGACRNRRDDEEPDHPLIVPRHRAPRRKLCRASSRRSSSIPCRSRRSRRRARSDASRSRTATSLNLRKP